MNNHRSVRGRIAGLLGSGRARGRTASVMGGSAGALSALQMAIRHSTSERVRLNAMLDTILPVSARAAGLCSDTDASKRLSPAALELVTAPTLIISARNDRYGTYAGAAYTASRIAGARFIGFDTGGHTWLEPQ